eukprot:SAG31_NODE_2502_length_5594_cov_3.175796_4_plen_69_part_00
MRACMRAERVRLESGSSCGKPQASALVRPPFIVTAVPQLQPRFAYMDIIGARCLMVLLTSGLRLEASR